MGLKVNSIAEFPENVTRSYYLYILDYYNWDEPIGNTLRGSFDKIAEFATKNDSIVIQGVRESHFNSELMSWKSINGIDPSELLPKVFIDIQNKKEINNFKIKKELKGGIGGVLNDTLILQPNIGGFGINFNNLLSFLIKK